MRILMTGGTGLIGRKLCKALITASHSVTVLSRRPESVKAKCGVSVQPMASLQEWSPEIVFDAVINLAGAPIVDARWSERRKQLLCESRIALTQALVEAITRAGKKPALLLSGSAIGFYGDGGDAVQTETSSHGEGFGAQLCVAWEQAAQQAQALGVRVVLLRTGVVLDASGGMLGRMLLPFKLGLGTRLGDGKQWISWIHIQDYIAIVLRLLGDSRASGPYNMTAPHPVTNAEFTQVLARVLRRPSLFVAPAPLLRLILGEMAELLVGGQRVLPARVNASGYRHVYPELESALNSLLG